MSDEREPEIERVTCPVCGYLFAVTLPGEPINCTNCGAES